MATIQRSPERSSRSSSRWWSGGLIAIVDGVFVRKDADGTVTFTEFDEIGEDEDLATLAALVDEEKDLLSPADVQELAAGLQPNSSALSSPWAITTQPRSPGSPSGRITASICSCLLD